MRLKLSVQYATGRRGLPHKASLARWASAALAGLGRRRVSLTVRIVGRAESAALNRRYRGRPSATNVLAFSFEDPPGVSSAHLGDLVICAPVVRREARAQGKPEKAHWAHMVVHGIMHLRGYDHRYRKEATVMEGKESRILQRLGFPDPYA